MSTPKLSVLLCTARGDRGYVHHPEWTILGKIIEDLEAQTFKDFELIVVDGLKGTRILPRTRLDVKHLAPRDAFWVRHRKFSVCAYRNTGIAAARGELIVNLDDCCELPPKYLGEFWDAWSRRSVAFSPSWPESGDARMEAPKEKRVQMVHSPNQVYGFGSYPRELALRLNGYDEAYDGSRGLEDADWGTRLLLSGLQMALAYIEGFRLHAQTGLDSRCVDPEMPVLKCCNLADWTERRLRNVLVANKKELWTQEWLRRLIGPCQLLKGDPDGFRCGYHNDGRACPYLGQGFAEIPHELAVEWIRGGGPVVELAELKR